MKKIASIILENSKGEILLYLRDNNPNIPFPHHWDLFGGNIEAGENPEQALLRELNEEIGFKPKEYHFLKKYECFKGDVTPNVKYVYVGKINKDIADLKLKEGEKLQFFKPKEIPRVKFANILKDIVLDYLKSK